MTKTENKMTTIELVKTRELLLSAIDFLEKNRGNLDYIDDIVYGLYTPQFISDFKDEMLRKVEGLMMTKKETEENTIQVPRWVLEYAKESLKMAHSCCEENTSTKRSVAKAHNFLKAYLDGKANDENLKRIVSRYLSANLD